MKGRPISTSATASPLITIITIFTITVIFTPSGTQGLCQHDGYFFPNGSTWRPEVCLECQCQGWVSVCQREHCTDLECPASHALYHNPKFCCPQCLPPALPCRAGGALYHDGEVWSLGGCEQCRCVNGTVSCGRAPCAVTTCPEGQVALQDPEQCCPECVPVGMPCHEGSTVHDDGDFWSPVSCSQCQCRNGRVQCYVTHCPPLTCPANHTLEVAPGSCCPACEGNPCVQKGMVYGSGEQWREGDCRECVCVAGRVQCHDMQCPDLQCQTDEKPYKEEGSCCPTCVKKQGWCLLETGVRQAPGSVWNISECEVCACRDAQVVCNEVRCEYSQCGPGEELVTRPGSCCPECAINLNLCFHDTRLRQNGEVWSSGSCRVCSCNSGKVTCHTPACSPCPPGLAPVSGTSDDCCPECQPLTCPPNCMTCVPGSPNPTCTMCEEGHYLQDGTCISSCLEGWFQQGGVCLACHPSCAACNQATRFHCSKCHPESMLREGECVSDCGRGFYPEAESCFPCHSSCAECSGPEASHCQVCQSGAYLHAGTCVSSCPSGYYPRERVCEVCVEHCERCGVGECLRCHDGFWLQDGRCLDQCLPGHYQGPLNTCLSCHSTCGTCDGPGILSCTSCPHYLLKSGSACVEMCPSGHYMGAEECLPCHPSCSQCLGPGEHRCVECSNDKQVVVLINGTAGECQDMCPENQKLMDHICISGSEGCKDWHVSEPELCLECEDGWLFQDQQCVRECTSGFFQDESGSICLPCDPRCNTCSGPSHKHCLSCHRRATLHEKGESAECLTKCYRRTYLAEDNTCQTCHKSCEACAPDPGNSSLSLCLQCKGKRKIPQGHQCVNDCHKGHFHHQELDRCIECHPSCATCKGVALNDCISCHDHAELSAEGTCEETQCPRGFYSSGAEGCIPCQGDCDTCSRDGTICITCPPHLHLLYGKCVKKCPHMFYVDDSADGECQECHWTCEECLGPTESDCLSCAVNMYLEGNKCLPQCSPGHYAMGKTCMPCPAGCTACNSSSECQACHSPYLLQDGQCSTSCKSGSFANVFNNNCNKCGQHCMSCSLYECHECTPPYLLQDGQCVDKCSKDYFPSKDDGICYFNMKAPTLRILAPLVAEHNRPQIINGSIVYVQDADTPNDRLKIILVEPPSNGVIFKVGGGQKMVMKKGHRFAVEDMHENRIMYKHESNRPLYGEMRLRVTDGHFRSSAEMISVNVISKNQPEILTNEPLIAVRGGSQAITSRILDIRDQDNSESVTVTVVDGPRHGHLSVRGEELVLFTLQELAEGVVTYTHDGSNVTTDMVLLQASDEHTVVNFLFQVYVVNHEKSIPVLVKNRGAKVKAGHRVQISPQLLQAADIDSDDGNLVYALLPMLQNPGHGKLILMIPLPPAPDGFYNDGWTQMDESHLIRPTTSFTQRDVNEGRVWYIHTDKQGQESLISDQLLFSVADSSHPPNILSDQAFVIQVEPSNEPSEMSPTPGVQLDITVQEGQAVSITPQYLSFSGGKSPEHLTYTITQPLGPYDGSLFNIDSPGLELRQFTQADINDMKIIYMPPLSDIGDEDKYFSFKFVVSDQMTGEPSGLPEQKFTIHVVPFQGSQLAFAHENPELTIQSRDSVLLEPQFFELKNLDQSEEIVFILLEAPQHGTITQEIGGESFMFTEQDSFSRDEVLNSRIMYTHDGSESSYDFIVILALGHSSEASSRISVTIRHEDDRQPTKSENASFSMILGEGESRVLSRLQLYFTDVHSPDEDLVYTLTSQPLYGSLTILQPTGFSQTLNQTHKFTQADILYGLINYTSNVEIGISEVMESLVFNVTDPNNNVLSNQVLKVRIQPVDNQEPRVTVGPAVEVMEGGSVVLPPSSVMATDADTPPTELRIIIDAPPIFGYITNTLAVPSLEPRSGPGNSSPMLEFTVGDVVAGRVAYVQSQHRHQEPTQDSLLFHVTDGINSSPTMRINITIQPVNDESPVILGEQVILEQGQTIVIRNQSLFISDTDTEPEDLIITIQQSPSHGSVHKKTSPYVSIKKSELLSRGQKFTFRNLLDELVLYSHDGSRDSEDVMEIMVSDGNHETGGIIEFIILRKTDEAPRLRLNHGLTLKAGEVSVISPSLLMAEDEDSEVAKIKYVVTRLPTSGSVELFQQEENTWKPLTVGSVFMQEDILNGNVRFSHQKDTQAGTDTLHFNLQDTEGNVMMDQALSITVLEDRVPPHITLNVGLSLMEDASAPITADLLSAMDAEMDPMELTFMLTSGPNHGQLELATAPGKAVNTWTQGALELGILRYQHQSADESPTDQFTFVVSDGYNNASQSFHINIIPVDDELPLLVLNHIKVQEGTRKTISQFEIEALDADTKDDLIAFEVTRQPRHGRLQIKKGDKYIDAKTFSMRNLYNGDVSYLHDGSDASRDSFKIKVSDSTNSMYMKGRGEEATQEPTTVHIEISSVDDGTPIITANTGLHFLQHEDGKAQNIITSHELHVEDEDTPPESLKFTVVVPPSHGVLRLTTHERPVSSFTQADIISGHLYYELTTYAQSVTSDHFTFEVTDSKPNTVTGNAFHIQWSWFVVAQREYNVTESDGEAKILVKRTGNLKQPSVVTCTTHTGSASGGKGRARGEDFTEVAEPIEFREGETEKYCTIPVHDDEEFEGPEVFTVKLTDPKYALIGKPKKSVVTIFDEEDKPKVEFETSNFAVDETEGFIFARLRRTGDLSVPASVICLTKDGSAKGSEPDQLTSGTDFIHRNHDESSRVVFPPGVKVSTCNVKIIDDPEFEDNEDFMIYLKDPSDGVILGEIHEATVRVKGSNDDCKIKLTQTHYNVSEGESTVSVTLDRTGIDLNYSSSVWCATKSFQPEEAQPSLDYVPHSEQVIFPSGVQTAVCNINIIDDRVNPRLEGPERFVVFISTAQNASIDSSAAEAVVTIQDEEDAPSMQFTLPEIKVRENQTVVKIPIQRTGDLSRVSTVHCFTRQRSAKAGIDFIERPNTKDSMVTFPRGVSKVECEVGILDDLVFEKEEEFIVKLSHPDSPSHLQPTVGENRITRVSILDWEDRPRVSFQRNDYTVAEPLAGELTSKFNVPIIRLGDVSQVTRVMVSTRDGSAASGTDYHPLHAEVEFPPGNTSIDMELTIVHNPSRQWHETFSLVLGPEEPVNAELGTITTAAVTILDHKSSGSSVLPAPPVVTSLLHYDNIEEHLGEPASPGYPLVCVTPCDPKYPESAKTAEMCAQAGLNASQMQYSWEVAIPADGDGLLMPFHSLTDDTLFASPNTKVLDSMFFARHFRVRCVAQPVRSDGVFGIPLRSKPISIGIHNGICQTPLVPGQPGGFQSQSFIATLSYINSTDEKHPNTVKIHVEIPHQDGMVPIVSTLPVHNLRYLLTEQLYRVHHTCSNMDLTAGFLAEAPDHQPINPRPYQSDFRLREKKSLELYQHLDLKTCMWTFSAWFSMSQLVDQCGGQVVSDFQVGSGGQSFLTVRVPLYISYVYAASPPGWASLDHRTELSVSFYYNTLLWHQGLHTQPILTAKIQVTRISIDESGRLVIDLKTVAKFRGQFVLQHPNLEDHTSRLVAPEDLEIQFSLELVWTASTWDGPEQVWRATSEYNLKDYTGKYKLELIPCTVTPTQSYSEVSPPACTPHTPTTFPLPIAIQQTHRPVPLIYTLNTDFQLFNSETMFLMDPKDVDNLQEVDYKGSYGPGQTIYGRVLWHPSQDLHSAYKLYIQRVFLCTGAEGYVPTYDPTGELYQEGPQYGCIQPSSKLRHRFLILDREHPYVEDGNLSIPKIEANFAEDLPEYETLHQFSGVDGFLLKTDALYEVNSGYQWYLQVLYTIGPSSSRSRRDAPMHTVLSQFQSLEDDQERTLVKRALTDPSEDYVEDEGEELPTPAFLRSLHTRNGTNMRGFQLDTGSKMDDGSIFLNVLYVIVVLVVLLGIIIAGLLLVKRHFRKSEKDKVIVVRSLKNEREQFRRKGEGKIQERPKTLPPHMTLNSESNLQTVKVKTLAITVRNNLEDEGTEV